MAEYRAELGKQLLGGKAFTMERTTRSGDTPESTEALYAQGHLSDVEARASLTGQGVVLVFIVSERSP